MKSELSWAGQAITARGVRAQDLSQGRKSEQSSQHQTFTVSGNQFSLSYEKCSQLFALRKHVLAISQRSNALSAKRKTGFRWHWNARRGQTRLSNYWEDYLTRSLLSTRNFKDAGGLQDRLRSTRSGAKRRDKHAPETKAFEINLGKFMDQRLFFAGQNKVGCERTSRMNRCDGAARTEAG